VTKNSNFSNQIKWYLSYEVLFFELADKSPQTGILVWENLVLICANDPEEAFKKATDHGRLSEEELLINDERGFCKFKGIRKLVPIYEDLNDGAELEWHEFELSPKQMESLIPQKEELQAFQSLTDFVK
jgi:hypothetical protein